MDVSQLAVPLMVSAVVALGGQFVRGSTDSEFLKENITATKELASAVGKLEVKLGIFSERYVTRQELEAKLKEAKHGS